MTSNRLPALAAAIRRAHDDMNHAAKTAAERALDAGHALIEAKALVKHGGWLPFLAQAGVHERAAQRLMTLAASGLKSDIVSDLGGVAPCLRFLSLRERGVAKLREAEAAAGMGIENMLNLLQEALRIMDETLEMFPAEDIEKAKRASEELNRRAMPLPGVGRVVRGDDRLGNYVFLWPVNLADGVYVHHIVINIDDVRPTGLFYSYRPARADAFRDYMSAAGDIPFNFFLGKYDMLEGADAAKCVAWLESLRSESSSKSKGHEGARH